MPRVPLLTGAVERTEVDMKLGDVLFEAKLTEGNFQTQRAELLRQYRDLKRVFECRRLPRQAMHYSSYQLLRNVLAAYALQCSFCTLVDARRPDLTEAWYAVMKCVKPIALRTSLRISTWQELAQAASPTLRAFLAEKYGIGNPCCK